MVRNSDCNLDIAGVKGGRLVAFDSDSPYHSLFMSNWNGHLGAGIERGRNIIWLLVHILCQVWLAAPEHLSNDARPDCIAVDTIRAEAFIISSSRHQFGFSI